MFRIPLINPAAIRSDHSHAANRPVVSIAFINNTRSWKTSLGESDKNTVKWVRKTKAHGSSKGTRQDLESTCTNNEIGPRCCRYSPARLAIFNSQFLLNLLPLQDCVLHVMTLSFNVATPKSGLTAFFRRNIRPCSGDTA